SASDLYCTGCGKALPRADDDADPVADEPTPALAGAQGSSVLPLPVEQEPSAATAAPEAAPRRRRWYLLAVALIALAGIATAAVFALLWLSQTQHVDRVQAQLEATRVQLSSTESRLVRTQGTLNAVSSLAQKRRAVLLRTQDVLSKVDALLSSVDAIQ